MSVPQSVNSPDKKDLQQYTKLFSTIEKTDKSSDGISGNIFRSKELNTDYKKALTSKDPDAKQSFIKDLMVLDYFAGENADKKTDGLIDGKSIFDIKDKEKSDLLETYNQVLKNLGLNRPQENTQITPDSNLSIPNPIAPLLGGLGSLGAGLDPFGVGEIKALAASLKPRNYSSQQVKEMNSQGIYTSASEMTPEITKNITDGKVKDVQAGRYGGVKLNEAQVNNAKVIAATIVDVGKKKNQSPEQIKRAVVVALATAMQESGIKNIGYGDRDSVGLFQQRPSCGWGSKEQCQDPVYATKQFANKLYQTDYMNKSVTGAAQNVQRSAFPNAYAKWQNMAEELATKMLS